jgi:hypothetical protein
MFEPPSLPEEDRRRIDSNVIQQRFLELCELKWEKLFQKSTMIQSQKSEAFWHLQEITDIKGE